MLLDVMVLDIKPILVLFLEFQNETYKKAFCILIPRKSERAFLRFEYKNNLEY